MAILALSIDYYNGTHNNVCTKLRTTVYGGGRGLRGPVGVGWCACDKTNTVNHVHAHLVGFGGVCRGSVRPSPPSPESPTSPSPFFTAVVELSSVWVGTYTLFTT